MYVTKLSPGVANDGVNNPVAVRYGVTVQVPPTGVAVNCTGAPDGHKTPGFVMTIGQTTVIAVADGGV